MQYNISKNRLQLSLVVFSFAILFCMQSVEAARPAKGGSENAYFRIENSSLYEETEMKVTSIGAIGFGKNSMGNMDLSFLKSSVHGDAVVLNAGAGFSYKLYATAYVGLGITLGYHQDDEEVIAGYYPDAGIVIDITKKVGLSLSIKRYYSLYDNSDDEDIIMLGLVLK